MPSVQNNTVHPVLTARRGLTYEFTPKHHGGSATASCWLTVITFAEEFSIFDRADGIVVAAPGADNRQVIDVSGKLYGYEILGAENQHLRELGTWGEQMSEYPAPHVGHSWHGYPIWPRRPIASTQFQGQRCRPDSQVFDRMVQLGDITLSHRKRLMKGNFI